MRANLKERIVLSNKVEKMAGLITKAGRAAILVTEQDGPERHPANYVAVMLALLILVLIAAGIALGIYLAS